DDSKYLRRRPAALSAWISRALGSIVRYTSHIASTKQTRNVFFFLLLNATFTIVEFVYGYLRNSLGLVSDAVHMLFDCTALVLSLWAGVVADTWPARERSYSYGFARVESVAGFVNAVALVFASGGLFWEGIERMYSPPDIDTNSLLVVSILGLLVNLLLITAELVMVTTIRVMPDIRIPMDILTDVICMDTVTIHMNPSIVTKKTMITSIIISRLRREVEFGLKFSGVPEVITPSCT
ncbi:hypothetical protein HDU82_003969, partial [Entophlyctis luteolus]